MRYISYAILMCLSLSDLGLAINKKPIDIENAYKMLIHRNQTFKKTISKETCEILCKNRTHLVPKPNHKPLINGCGSYNLTIDFSIWNMIEFNNCCDVHDGCYENCTSTKQNCDLNFDSCLKDQCDIWSKNLQLDYFQKLACKAIAKIMWLLVTNLGCVAYKMGIESACECV